MYDEINISKIDLGLSLNLKFNLAQDENSFLEQIVTTGIIANKLINDKIVMLNFNSVLET